MIAPIGDERIALRSRDGADRVSRLNTRLRELRELHFDRMDRIGRMKAFALRAAVRRLEEP